MKYIIILLAILTLTLSTEASDKHFYTKLSGVTTPGNSTSTGGAVTLGIRAEKEDFAYDFSLTGGGLNNGAIWNTPKIMYLKYSNPCDDNTFYYGGGLSWGGIRNKSSNQYFEGIMAELAIGYRFNRSSNLMSFIELTASQPVIPTNRVKTHITPPALSLGLGLGF